MKERFQFLNWRPDAEAFGNDGLTVAQNVIHDTEGWKPVYLASSGAFSTTGGLAATSADILSLVARPVGTQGDYLAAWIADATTPTLHVGLNGVTETSTTTGYPLAFTTAFVDVTTTPCVIYAFDVTEYAGYICFTVEGRMGTSTPSTTEALRFTGYMSF